MKRHILLIMWAFLLPLLALAQSDGYDPNNPPQPNWPEDDVANYFTVTCEAIPAGAGQFGGNANQKVKPGSTAYVYAYDHNGCYFQEWCDTEGNTLSTESTYSFTMPEENVKLYAKYSYSPDSPLNPTLVVQYQLSLKSDPVVAGTFNFKDQKVDEGTTVDLRAYSNSGFKFLNWTDENGEVVGTDAALKFLMPSHASTLTAHYEYAPEEPQNPGTNFWDATLGELIIDFFTPGRLYAAMDAMVGTANRDKATSLTVDGEMTSNDWNLTNYYKKLTYIDLSRVEGVTQVPSSTWLGNTDLQEIELPKDISSIGNYAFQGCNALQRFNIYATVPPTLGTNVFDGVPADMVVFVPESSVELYKAADGWKEFTIVPLLSKICTLEVNLPDDYSDGRYKNMQLEVVNVRSGQKYKYVITDRKLYTFPTLIRKTSYKAYIKTQRGQTAAETDVIDIDQETVSVTFDEVLVPRTVSVNVIAANADVTDQVSVKWTDADGNYQSTGSETEGYLPGSVLRYLVELPEQLGRQYIEPDTVTYTVAETSNNAYTQLVELPTVTLGNVWKAYIRGSELELNTATFTISQTLNGKYTAVQTQVVKSGEDPELTLFDAPTVITLSASDYISETYEIADLSTGFPGRFELKPATGPVVNVAFTWQPTVVEGETPQVENFYPDYANVSYTLQNLTQGTTISSFTVQYPSIKLPDDVNEGDVISITAKSTTDAFNDVTVNGKVEGNSVSVTIPIVEHGGIKARFLVTDNTAVEGLLFDEKGTLISHSLYGNFNPQALEGTDANDLAFTNLADGTYTLITMGQSDFFSSMFDLSHFDEAGLQEDVDFVKNVIKVESGTTKAVRNVVIPVFNEQQFYYTGTNTSFTSAKANVIQGNYLTLNARLDFNDHVKADVREVELVIPLPINSDFVEGSLMIGKDVAAEYQYQYTDNREKTADPDANGTGFVYTGGEHSLTVQLGDNYSERVKFCVVPLKRGNYSPTAFVRFKLDGKTITQPIGSAAYTVNDVTIWTPKVVGEDIVHIDGNAPAFSNVYVYADGYFSSYTQTLADGYWWTECKLPLCSNLSMHSVYAVIETPEGYELTTERRFVEYNISHIQGREVEMSFFNNAVNRTVVVNFDLEHSRASQKSYPFEGGTEFVFTANLTNNSPELVDSCVVRVFTNNHEWIELPARYIENLDRWVAHSKFDTQTMPIGVRVNVESDYSDRLTNRDLVFEFYNNRVNARGTTAARAYADEFAIELEPVGDEQLGSVGRYFQCPLSSIDAQQFQADTLALPTLEDTTVNVYVADDGSFFVDNPDADGMVWGVKYGSAAGARAAKVRIATDLTTELKQRVMELAELAQALTPYTNRYNLEQLWAMYKQRDMNWNNYPATTPEQVLQQTYDHRMALIFDYALDNIDEITQIARNANDLLSYVRYGIQDVDEWQTFADRILPCNGLDDPQARALNWQAQRFMVKHGWQYITSVEMAIASAQMLLNHLSPSNVYYLLSTASENDLRSLYDYANQASDFIMNFSTSVYLQNKAASRNHIRKAKRDKNRYINCGYTMTETIEDKFDFSLPYPVVEPIIDPSGYVYEGVSSNRLEGVTATAYYKHTYEDIYGDMQQEIVKWDAENYGQENPLYTDAEGMYAWDVPQGLWQVKFEKEGYQTAYSEWLPVPPPQLDVNIAMTQLAQPEVVKARAFEAGTNTSAGVEITFSKYMKPELLTAENIFIKGVKDQAETLIEGLQFTCPDLEAAVEGSDLQFAKKVFAATTQLNQFDEVYVIVSRVVESYAGIQMTETYEQKIDIEKQITGIQAEETLNIGFGQNTTLLIAALPTEAAVGKKISVSVASAKIASLNDALETIELTLDANGQAELTVNGVLFGTTALQMKVVGEEISAQTMVNVVDPAMLETVKAPAASRISGTAVYRGQTVSLSCETEGATIYYTTDGSCPCDSETRQVYQSPIAINEAMTLKAMSVGINGTESDVQEFHYLIRQTNLTLDLAAGWNWASHNLATPVKADSLAVFAAEVLTQSDATEVAAEEAVKLHVATATQQQFTGDQYNPMAKSITLQQGWNWLGYPIDQTLTLADALSQLQAEEGDVIANLVGGFAEYTDGQWKGLLLTMDPGQGYLYKSASQKTFIYNAVPTTNARALRAQLPRRADDQWTVNPHLYHSMMPVTLQLFKGATDITGQDYTIVAFADEECRGIGQTGDGVYYLPVYGNATDETITLRLIDADGEEVELESGHTFAFLPDVLGSAKAPHALVVLNDESEGISDITSDDDAAPVYNLSGQRVKTPAKGIFVKNGQKVTVK